MKTSKFYVFCDEWNITFSFILYRIIYICIYTAYKIIFITLLQAIQVITK